MTETINTGNLQNFKNINTFSVRRKISVIFFIMLCFAFLPELLKAQESPQGFFLDSWMPKNIEISDFITVPQVDLPATVSVTIETDSIISKISKYVYGHNAGAWGGKLEQNSKLVSDISNLAPNVIRWPGGSNANNYFWNATSKETCPNDLPPNFVYAALEYGANDTTWTMSTDSYYKLLAKTGSTGIICVNYAYARIGTSNDPVAAAAKLAADWVRYDNGRTRYWEIGNENYGSWEKGFEIDISLNKDGQPKTISGDLYGRHCKVFIEEMRKAASEVGNDIKIGVVGNVPEMINDSPQRDWNTGVMPHVAGIADFIIVHSYFTPYKVNSSVASILNSPAHTKEIKDFVNSGLKTYANHDPLPLAMTEYNIFAEGSMQGVSYVNGMHAVLVIGELMNNQYGLGCRWDFINEWWNGENHGLFADGDPGIARYTPRAPFFYLYYFQKFFGDNLIYSHVDETTDVVTYASKFSSGQTGIVLVNKGTTDQVIGISMNNFNPGGHYYYYQLTGGTDNGDFSRKVYVNGITTPEDGGGPAAYDTIKPYGTLINAQIKLSLAKWTTVFVVVDCDTCLLSQSIQFDSIQSKIFGDPDYEISAMASSGLPVMFISLNPDVATISDGNVHIVGAGTCKITARQDGNSVYKPADQVTQTFFVEKGSQSISFPVLPSKMIGDPDFSPEATASSGLSCSFTSSNPNVAIIVSNIIHIIGEGMTLITAIQAGNANFNIASDVSQELTVFDPTGIKVRTSENDFELITNPNGDFITIRLKSVQSKISIYNSLGSLLYKTSTSASELVIPLSLINENGLYFIRVNSSVKKFCVSR
jgi:hypothetical protein